MGCGTAEAARLSKTVSLRKQDGFVQADFAARRLSDATPEYIILRVAETSGRRPSMQRRTPSTFRSALEAVQTWRRIRDTLRANVIIVSLLHFKNRDRER